MSPRLPRVSARWLVFVFVLAVAGAAWAGQELWLPAARDWVGSVAQRIVSATASEDRSADAEDDHAHDEHAESIELSPQSRRTIGLEVGTVRLSKYARQVTVPARVIERPGSSRITVAAPLTGVITATGIVDGEAVRSGKQLFKLRLTHEDLVQAQTEFLRTLGQLDVEQKEIERLERITSGAVAGKVLLEREYERDKLKAVLRAEREALLLHGLSDAQVQRIVGERKLIRDVEITAPLLHPDASLHDDAESPHPTQPVSQTGGSREDSSHEAVERQFVVVELLVHSGQVVQAGDPLCVLADLSELFIEGLAFEQDADELVRATEAGRSVTAVLDMAGERSEAIEGLTISHISNEVARDSRTLHFYIRLPNTVVRDAVRDDGRHFLSWRFKPGQRMQLRIPVEEWTEAIVLPVGAVAEDAVESYVFVENGRRFERRPVHVAHRDSLYAVIANDGSLFPGETVAMNAAHQLQMALKNQGGGGADAHAHHGHSH